MFRKISEKKVKKTFYLIIALLLGAVLFQSFQCASPEMSTAKMAYQNKEYEKALENLKKEISNNPTNEEAYILKTDVLYRMGRFNEATESAFKAKEKITTPPMKMELSNLIFTLWVDAYNKGLFHLNEFNRTREDIYKDSAIVYFNSGIKIRPNMPDFHDFKGRVYESAGDDKNAIKAYMEYIDVIQEELDLAKNNKVYVDMPRNEFLARIGQPTKTSGGSIRDDSLLTDLFQKDGMEIIAVSRSTDGAEFLTNAWRVNPPADWLPGEKTQGISLSTDPIAALAQMNYEAKKYEDALKYIRMLLLLQPNNSQASSSVVTIYTEMGKLDEALKSLNDLTKSDPNNKFNWAQFGDVYSNLGAQEESKEYYKNAIDKYNEALKLDPNYEFVLRNMASAYKNLASLSQIEQQKKIDEDPNFEPNTDEYFPDLKKSAEYFEKALKTEKFKNDFQVLGELSNIYTVLDEEESLREVLRKLEAIEFDVPEQRREQYYLILLRIYSDLKESDKVKVVRKKIENLN